jgi:neutral ceramidase
MTEEMGRRVRASVLSAVPASGISRVVISGLANEYVSYFTTPEEYERQHYEGSATLYGEFASNLIKQSLIGLARRLVTGQPAPAPYPYDPKNGFGPNGPPFPAGARSASALQQPQSARRFGNAVFRWRGGPRGQDRPVGRAFVSIERRVHGKWKHVTDDLGLEILWTVSGSNYRAKWEIPLDVHRGRFRFVITGKRYRLVSHSFRVRSFRDLKVRRVASGPGRVAVALGYPPISLRSALDAPITWHPELANGGVVHFRVGGKTRAVRRKRSKVFSVDAPPGTSVSVLPRGARDRFGNFAAAGVRLR